MDKYLKQRGLSLAAVVIGLMALFACAGGQPPDPFEGRSTLEHRWTAELEIDGQATPLTVLLFTGTQYDGRGRIIILSAFGASLGECAFTERQMTCGQAAPGLKTLTGKLGQAFRDLLGTDGLWLLSDSGPDVLNGQDWSARRDGLSVNYRRQDKPAWELRLQTLRVKQ